MPTSKVAKHDHPSPAKVDRSSPQKRKREAEEGTTAIPDRTPPRKDTTKPALKTKVKDEHQEKTINKSSRGNKALKSEAPKTGQAALEIHKKGKHTNGTSESKATERNGRKPKNVTPEDSEKSDSESDGNKKPAPKKRQRKTKEEKDAEAMPLAARATGLAMFVGAHTSIAKGVENAVTNCVHIGGNAFAMFLKSQRKWDNPPLKDENRDAFVKMCSEHNYDAASHVLPHGSYLVNLAQEDKDKARQAYDAFLDDLQRCEKLGIKYYNFHPGAAGKAPVEEAIGRIASQLNQALAETKSVVPVLENMCGAGSIIGSRFTDLRDIIAGIKPEFQFRMGVCLDTCHTFAGGYDLRTPNAFKETLDEFDKVVGMKYLKALHLNDSKAPLDSKRDLHQNIGVGFLGLRAFHNVMNEPRFQNMPLILETPCDRVDPNDPTGKKVIEDKSVWAREIKLLESLIGMDPEDEEFKGLEKELSDKGEGERAKMQKAVNEKNDKAKKKLEKEREKGQKSLMYMMGGGKKQKKISTPVTSDEEDLD